MNPQYIAIKHIAVKTLEIMQHLDHVDQHWVCRKPEKASSESGLGRALSEQMSISFYKIFQSNIFLILDTYFSIIKQKNGYRNAILIFFQLHYF